MFFGMQNRTSGPEIVLQKLGNRTLLEDILHTEKGNW